MLNSSSEFGAYALICVPELIKQKRNIMEGLAEERYISLLTDFCFKRIFGTNLNKDLMNL